MSRASRIAWTASAALHLTAGAAVLIAVPPPAEKAMPVMLMEMPELMAPEPEPEADPVAEPLAAAPAEPAPTEPPPPEPLPQLADAQPKPVPPEVQPSPEPPAEPQPPPEELASLPLPPPPPPPKPVVQHPVTPPRRPPPRPAVPSPVETPAPPTPAPAAATPAAVARVAAAPSPSYAAKLMRALERHRRYPDEARYRRVEGIALLRFRMARDGTVTGYQIERSSGSAALDQAVQTMIQNASPLPAPPDDLLGNPVELTVPIRFILK